jgi:hypothetical protein
MTVRAYVKLNKSTVMTNWGALVRRETTRMALEPAVCSKPKPRPLSVESRETVPKPRCHLLFYTDAVSSETQMRENKRWVSGGSSQRRDVDAQARMLLFPQRLIECEDGKD